MGAPSVAVTGLREQAKRILASPQFNSSRTLSRLFEFLVEQAILHPNEAVKEHQIAVDSLGRPDSFDPRVDAMVRVHTGRLRHKLEEFYAGPGREDSVVVVLPKGTYSLQVFVRGSQAPVTPPANGTAIPPASHPLEQPPWRRALLAILGSLLLIALVALVWDLGLRPTIRIEQSDPALRAFWANFVAAPEAPLLVFSNAEFVVRPDSGMRYFDSDRDAPQAVMDHYTGVGEVNAVHELTAMFDRFRRDVRVKRARLLSMDDARAANVVFIGSTAENQILRGLPIQQDFAFEWVPASEGVRYLSVVNRKPRDGEFTRLLASAELPVQEDYAIVSLLPGLSPGRWIMLLAGTTTFGTQAAVEFACSPDTARELLQRSGQSTLTRTTEAVIRTEVRGGVPVQNRLLAVHVR